MGANHKESSNAATSDSSDKLIEVCAWCNISLNTDEQFTADEIRFMSKAEIVSHGICEHCMMTLKSDFKCDAEEVKEILHQ